MILDLKSLVVQREVALKNTFYIIYLLDKSIKLLKLRWFESIKCRRVCVCRKSLKKCHVLFEWRLPMGKKLGANYHKMPWVCKMAQCTHRNGWWNRSKAAEDLPCHINKLLILFPNCARGIKCCSDSPTLVLKFYYNSYVPVVCTILYI